MLRHWEDMRRGLGRNLSTPHDARAIKATAARLPNAWLVYIQALGTGGMHLHRVRRRLLGLVLCLQV